MIELSHVKKIYDKNGIKTTALSDVSLKIDDGEMLAVIGRSGSGKSTLLNIIGAMDHVTEGQYMYNDVDVTKLHGRRFHEFRKEHIAFIFQSFELMPQYTVYENVEMPLLVRNVSKTKSLIMDVLKQVGLDDMKDKKIEHLSGGQQQRCAIARAIAMNCDVILADEPTGALDSKTGQEILDIFKQLNEQGCTVIIVTHDMGVAGQCKRQIVIEDGRIKDSVA